MVIISDFRQLVGAFFVRNVTYSCLITNIACLIILEFLAKFSFVTTLIYMRQPIQLIIVIRVFTSRNLLCLANQIVVQVILKRVIIDIFGEYALNFTTQVKGVSYFQPIAQ